MNRSYFSCIWHYAVVLVCMLTPVLLPAQQYNVALIPDSLISGANVVKRFSELKINITGIGKAEVKRRYVLTILNEKGDRFAVYQNYYDRYADLSDISGTLYDAAGNKLKNVRKKDIEDVSMNDGISLMNDGRVKLHNFYYRQYPYTVEYEDVQTLDGFTGLDHWDPVEALTMSVQQSRYVIETPKEYGLRYKQFNYPGSPVVTEGKTRVYTWEVKNLKVYPYEPFLPDYHEITPYVYAAPGEFIYGGYKGSMNTWQEYGMFQLALNKGRDQLPDNIRQQVHAITDTITDTVRKIKALYRYMQQNTRYISIQLGIGGFQPFDATYVATKKYGDCKALSNYMVSLLKEAGVEGYYCKIYAGRGEKFFMPDFPSRQSNHIIVAVPLSADTIWLECTDQDIAPGYLGSFTDDRFALMIKPDGGHLVKTPRYTMHDNTRSTKVESSIDINGRLSATVNTRYTGLEQDEVAERVTRLTKDRQLEILRHAIDLPSYDITSFEYRRIDDMIPAVEEQFQLEAVNFATVSGKRIFITPNFISKNTTRLNNTGVRKYDIVYPYAFMHEDTISIRIPDGYVIESMPKDVIINNQFGQYEIRFAVDENGMLTCTRLYKRSENRFPPDAYPELVKFYDGIFKADRSKMVFVKKES